MTFARILNTTKGLLMLIGLGVLLFLAYRFLYPPLFEAYTGTTNTRLEFPNSEPVTEAQFEQLALDLTEEARRARAESMVDPDADALARRLRVEMLMNTRSVMQDSGFDHIRYFREAEIRQYEGPQTCLRCHEEMSVTHANGSRSTVDTLEDLVDSVHFKLQSDEAGAFSTYGFDGRQVNAEGSRPIPVGKIDRACGIPGSFTWTGWAVLIESHPEGSELPVMRSEGCGQCHIGGNYGPATEKMMPIGDVPEVAKDGIDCLICHAADYDMNQRYVLEDDEGLRWNQDRSLRAALTVGQVTDTACLRCHQHNFGGDAYAHNAAAQALGEKHPRLLHTGAKRGTPFHAEDDVHAAAGLQCTDCHVPEGHKIPRGRMGVDLVANDLPDREVSCVNCHSLAPHTQSDNAALLNGHIDRIACETCHIPHLEDNSVVLRDWVHPSWDAEEGLWTPTDIYRSGKPGKGLTYLWFNGNGSFLANALGDNPEGGGDYNPLMNQLVKIKDPEVIAAVRAQAETLKQRYPEIDVEAYVQAATDPLSQLSPEQRELRGQMVEQNLRQAMADSESRIYPFKIFNALMFEDMNNQGPFGAMILPFDLATYYGTGDSRQAVIDALAHPIVQRMYQEPFKRYMMDEFMAYFGVAGGWTTDYPVDENGQLKHVQPHWMRQMGTLMVNHGIRREAHGCLDCHSEDGILDYQALGYSPERTEELSNLEVAEDLAD